MKKSSLIHSEYYVSPTIKEKGESVCKYVHSSKHLRVRTVTENKPHQWRRSSAFIITFKQISQHSFVSIIDLKHVNVCQGKRWNTFRFTWSLRSCIIYFVPFIFSMVFVSSLICIFNAAKWMWMVLQF